MKNKGITLVALIITIIIILILAGVGISISLSVIDNTKQAAFISKMTAIEEQVNLILLDEEMAYHQGETITSKLTSEELKLLLADFNDFDIATKTAIFEKRGETFDSEKTYTDEDIVNLFKLGNDITGDSGYASIYDSEVGAVYKIEPVVIGGEKNVGTGRTGILKGKRTIAPTESVNEAGEPVLTGFNKDITYYVTFDNAGNAIKGNNLNGAAPTDWYNYEEKKWANILVEQTIGENTVQGYFVWIPRYEYKSLEGVAVPATLEDYRIEANIISKDQKTASEGYKIPEAFIFGKDENNQPLHIEGFWAAKYEMSNDNSIYQVKPEPTSWAYGTANDLFINTRKMESAGQLMGLTETINEANGAATSASNNIDVHMMKNTEYGAIAILSASNYGEVRNGTVNDLGEINSSTTSNVTGVYQMADNSSYEYLAAIYNTTNQYMSKLKVAADNAATAKYVDLYNNHTNQLSDYTGAKTGDATGETPYWYGASSANFVNSSYPVFGRGWYGMFSFGCDGGNAYSSAGVRASVVSGRWTLKKLLPAS